MEVSKTMIALHAKVDNARDLTVKKMELQMDNLWAQNSVGFRKMWPFSEAFRPTAAGDPGF